MDAFIPFAILVVVKATILLAIAAGAAMLLRRRSASLRHFIWSLAIAGCVVLPAVAAVSPVTLHMLPERPAAAPFDPEPASPPGVSPSVEANDDLAGAARDDVPAAGAATTPAAVPFDWAATFAVIWLVGALLLLARFGTGVIGVRRVARRAVPIDDASWLAAADRVIAKAPRSAVTLRISDAIAMPFVAGVIRPTIILPATSLGWSPERREAVLLHELAHLSRGDLLMNIVSHIARAIYWFNPLAWLAAHRLRIESERACDDAVLRRGALASDYADHLLSIATHNAPDLPAAALAMARRSAFEGRLLAILEPGIERATPSRWRIALTSAAFVAVILPLAAASPTARVSAMPAGNTFESSAPAPAPAANTPAVQEPTGAPTRQVAQNPERPQEQPPTSAVAALMGTLSDANASVRLAAINSLGSLGDPRAIAALGKALREDTDPRVREAAAQALGEIDDPRAVPHLTDALRSERVARVKVQIIEALSEIDDSSAVSGVVVATRDSSAAVRRAAVSALGEFEDQTTLNAIVSLARDEDVEVRRRVADAIGNFENPSTLNTLIAMTRDSDAEVREHAVNALGNLEDPRSLDALVATLKDASPDVRSQAADAIHNIPDLAKAPPQLIAALADEDHEVRQNVAHALGDIGDDAAVPALRRALSDNNIEVRRAVAEALSEIGGVDAITALMGLLKDPDPEIRRTAAEALGKRR